MTLDLSKPVRTRKGHAVNIYATDGQNPDFPLVGEYSDEDGDWYAESWSRSGRQNSGSECGEDLINAPEPVEFGIDLHENGNATVYVPATEDGRIVDKIKRLEFRYHPDRTGTDMIEVVSVEGV